MLINLISFIFCFPAFNYIYRLSNITFTVNFICYFINSTNFCHNINKKERLKHAIVEVSYFNRSKNLFKQE